MANELDGIQPLFPDYNKMQFAIRQYSANCIAHRLTKFGWEKEFILLEPRLLILVAMCMPTHARMPIITFAWKKAFVANDTLVLAFMEKHCPGVKMVNRDQIPEGMVPV